MGVSPSRGAPPAQVKSDEFGVSLDKRKGKWFGTIRDPFEHTASGKPKRMSTAYFADEAACVVATRVLSKQMDEKYRDTIEPLAAADPLTKGLPRGPNEASEAEVGVVYWRPNYMNGHKPYRAVRVGIKRVRWTPAPVTEPATANPQSDELGVKWDKSTGKWRGQINDPLDRRESGKQKNVCTPRFADKAACVVATRALREQMDEKYWDTRTELAAADPLTKGLPRGPKDALEAELDVVYWRPNRENDHNPYRVVRTGLKKVMWLPACQHDGCTLVALQAVQGAAREFCFTHGGHCPHGHAWITCRECNTNVTKTAACCSLCAKRLTDKRIERNGGTGFCGDCDAKRAADAAEAGHALPPKGKKWEDLVLDELVALVTDTDGNVISCESRDDMSNMLGSNKRRRTGECDTNHQRRPDILWIVRDADARIVAALDVEVDEHSHTDRDPACETGKVDETYQSIVQLAQTEGAAKGAAARAHVRGPPFVLVLKINPNACDAPGPRIPLKERIRVLAEICNNFLRTPAETFHAHAEAGYTTMPNVQCLFYHTKQGAKNLTYFDENTPGAWRWAGNECRTDGSALRFLEGLLKLV